MEKKILWKAVGIFFGVMAAFTVLSRVAYQQGTAVVHTSVPTSGTINHTVRANGKTFQTQDVAVFTQSDLRVNAVMAAQGQQVKAGDVLFSVDMDYLEEKIASSNRDLDKQKLTIQDAQSQGGIAAIQRANAKAQAEENYNAAVSGAEQNLIQAQASMNSAQKALEDYYVGAYADAEKARLAQVWSEAQNAVTQAQSELSTLEQELQDAIQRAIDEARSNATQPTQEPPVISVDQDTIRQQVEAEYAFSMRAAQENLSTAQHALELADRALNDYYAGTGEDMAQEANLKLACQNAEAAVAQAQSELYVLEDKLQTAIQLAIDEANSSTTVPSSEIQLPQVDEDAIRQQVEAEYAPRMQAAQDKVNAAQNAAAQAKLAFDSYNPQTPAMDQKLRLRQAYQDAALAATQAQTEMSTLEQEIQSAVQRAIDEANAAAAPDNPVDQGAIRQQVEAEYAPRMQAAREKLYTAQAAAAQAKQALDNFINGAAPSEQELLNALEQAKKTYTQAADRLSEVKRTYGQAVKTASLSTGGSNSAQIGQITYEQMEEGVKKLEALRDAGGKVLAPMDGVITACYVRTGQMTSDTTALLLAGNSQGWHFKAELTSEQSKYIGTGDQVTLRLESNDKEYNDLPVVAFSATDTGATVTVDVPSEEIPLGASMELRFTRKSQAYRYCVPLTALHMDERNQPYVLTISTVNTVLGEQTQAVKIAVTVLDKNDTTVAVEAASLDGKAIIVSSDRAVDSGSRVRVE